MPDAPALSLIVCTLGRKEPLIRLLQSLSAQSFKDFEILLVDQNPPGYLDEVLASHGAGLPLVPVRSAKGLSRARNVGLSLAAASVVAFPDDDCWYAPDTLARVWQWFADHPQAAGMTCPTRDASGALSNGRFLKETTLVDRYNIWVAGNSNGVFVCRDWAVQVGGFDETLGVGSGTRFGAGEETDFLLHILAGGGWIVFRHDIFVHHDQVNQTFDVPSLDRARLYAQGFGRVLRLHDYALSYALFRSARSFCAALLGLLGGRLGYCHFKLIWAVGTLAGYFADLKEAVSNKQMNEGA